jgi:hypothetical protein
MFQVTKNIVKALTIIALFVIACSVSVDQVVMGSSAYSHMIKQTPSLYGFHLLGIFSFWLVVFLIPDWKFKRTAKTT